MLTALAKLFNLILITEKYPDGWNKSFIVPIYKNGYNSNPSNYRGISLMSCLSKLFNMVINNRLVDVFDKQIKPQQFGLKKNSRTSDGVFVLKSLVKKNMLIIKSKKSLGVL